MRCESCGAVRDSSSSSPGHCSITSSPTTTFSAIEFQDLLRSPGLSTDQTSQISSILASLDNDVNQYDARLRRLRSDIASLENERSLVQAQQQRYKSLLAPVRRLPTELLDHIFRIYGYTNQNCIQIENPYSPPRKKDRLPGLVVMGVCTRWRDVAQSCTALWSNISLNVSIVDNPRLEALVMPLQWCLDHAGPTAPLDIAFTGMMPQEGTSEPKVVRILASHASRWRHASFTTSDWGLREFPSLDAIRFQTLPLLESLHSYKYAGSGDAELMLFGKAPKLRELSCNCGLPEESEALYSDFPWTQIRTLELEYNVGENDQFCLLDKCSNVRSLCYSFPTLASGVEVPPQRSESVSSLEISIQEAYAPPDIFGALLDAADFPGLEQMKLRFKFTTWPETAFTSFLLRSKCSLTSLLIEDAVVSDNDLVSLLMCTPGLESFSVHQHSRRDPSGWATTNVQRKPSLTMAFIRRLHAFRDRRPASPSDDGILIPKLKTLSLRVLGAWFNDDELFVDVVRSRWIPNQGLATNVGVECLKSVELQIWGREPGPELYKSLSQLGLKVEVSSKMDSVRTIDTLL